MDCQAKLKEYTGLIDAYLSDLLQEVPCKQQNVLRAMAYSVEAGGKRIRPVLVLEFCRLCGGEFKKALPFAAAVEMIHSYSLIHDDLPCMDNDDFRRGKPSCHKAFGEANALLAGDGLLTLAFQMLARAELPAERVVQAVAVLSEYAGVRGMIGGQVIDLESEGRQIEAETLETTYRLKTAALLMAACELGCIAAGGSEKQRTAAREYAQSLGFAFQITDDILDVEGDSGILGKPVGSDEENEKQTYVTLYGLQRAKADAKSYSDAAQRQLEEFPEHVFLSELTEMLAVRKY